jgi:uncharacterized protein (UPF0332 family)
MASQTMVERLLDSADALLTAQGNSSAFRRRAVSSAYYAVFHALARQCADFMTQGTDRTLESYSRVYRSLEHGPLKQAFLQEPLKQHAKLGEAGQSIVHLQAERFKADYAPPIPGLFSLSEAKQLVSVARATVTTLSELSKDETRDLASLLYFQTRRR